MVRGCHAVYCYDGSELIVKDQLAVGAFNYGEIVQYGNTDGTNLGTVIPAAATMSAAGQGIAGVANEDLTTTGTVGAGTVETCKVIVNPNQIYRIEVDNSAQITWTAATDTTIAFASAGSGWVNGGGGWAWSYNTGELDWIVSSAVAAGTTTLTTVTGTNTSSTSGIVVQGIGPKTIGMNTAPATTVDGDNTNITDLTDGAGGAIDVLVVNNYITSSTYGVEMLRPAVRPRSWTGSQGGNDGAAMNQVARLATSPDFARLFTDVALFPSMAYQAE
jgi:hypothetical protein